MESWQPGYSTIEYLLRAHKLEELAIEDADLSAAGQLQRACRRLDTSRAALGLGDPEGSFVLAYDAYRMAADSLLIRQALRATDGQGSHAAVEDAVSAQFAAEIPSFAKPTFERLRRTRNALQYFDPAAPEISAEDAEWSIEKAADVTEAVLRLFESGQPTEFRLS